MREIKFRAWDSDNKKFIDLFGFRFSSCGEIMAILSLTGDMWGPGGVEVQECTGLKDKTGKDIYEGDIFKFDNEDGSMGFNQVYYNENTAVWGWLGWNRGFTPFVTHCVHGSTDGGGVVCGEMTDMKKVEVIGNIYENATLIDRGKK